MAKNLFIISAFIAIVLAAAYFVEPGEPLQSDEELILLDSNRVKGNALFRVYADRPSVPDLIIKDEAGNSLTLNDFKGQSLLVNFWATWCVPCREEMPELDALQAAKGNDDFKVILVSVDRGGLAASRKFLNDIGIQNLALYYDEKGTLARKMKTIGYPSTILINKAGKQFGLLVGPANWNSARGHALIDRLIADE